MEQEAYRHVPYDIDVEQALLGAILADNRAMERASALVKPEHFYDPLHARIYETMSQMIERGGVVVTPLTLHATMKADPGVIETGGQAYFEAMRAAAYLRAFAANVDASFTEPLSLPGPTGEKNELSLHPRGLVACLATSGPGSIAALIAEAGAALTTGNGVLLWHGEPGIADQVAQAFRDAGVDGAALIPVESGNTASLKDLVSIPVLEAVCIAGSTALAVAINRTLAGADLAIRPVIVFRENPAVDIGAGQPLAGSPHYLHRFVHERSLSIDTTASGGNASLLSIGDGAPSQPGEV